MVHLPKLYVLLLTGLCRGLGIYSPICRRGGPCPLLARRMEIVVYQVVAGAVDFLFVC